MEQAPLFCNGARQPKFLQVIRLEPRLEVVVGPIPPLFGLALARTLPQWSILMVRHWRAPRLIAWNARFAIWRESATCHGKPSALLFSTNQTPGWWKRCGAGRIFPPRRFPSSAKRAAIWVPQLAGLPCAWRWNNTRGSLGMPAAPFCWLPSVQGCFGAGQSSVDKQFDSRLSNKKDWHLDRCKRRSSLGSLTICESLLSRAVRWIADRCVRSQSWWVRGWWEELPGLIARRSRGRTCPCPRLRAGSAGRRAADCICSWGRN